MSHLQWHNSSGRYTFSIRNFPLRFPIKLLFSLFYCMSFTTRAMPLLSLASLGTLNSLHLFLLLSPFWPFDCILLFTELFPLYRYLGLGKCSKLSTLFQMCMHNSCKGKAPCYIAPLLYSTSNIKSSWASFFSGVCCCIIYFLLLKIIPAI